MLLLFFFFSERTLKDLFVHNFNLHAHTHTEIQPGPEEKKGDHSSASCRCLGLQTAVTNCSLFTTLENIMDHFCNFSCKCTSAVSQDSA